jgi:D-alanyl-D-alanine carboxypeptidase (penicillin-binding protein 5/6)
MKRLTRSLSFILILAILLAALPGSVFATETATASDSFSVNASAAILVELNTDSILYEQAADAKVYPASLTKVMTCLLALENGNLDDVLTVSETALENLHPDGSSADLIAGEQMRLIDLLYCVMLASANDACNVVAEYVSGSISAFVDLMNERAAEIGCTGTHFANAHGLHDDDHYTTARDLARIAAVALENEEFLTICTSKTYTVPATNLSDERDLYTTNYLVSDAITPAYYYSKASGVKTGYTSQAGRCLISTASDNGLYLLSVVCGAQTVVLESGDLELQSFTETKKLLEYGLNNFDYATVLSSLDTIAQLDVNFSAGADSVVVAPTDTITSILPKDYDEDLLERDVTLDNPDGVDAPISEGDKLGSVTVTYDGNELGSADLVAITDVPRSEVSYFRYQVRDFMLANWWKLLLGLFGILFLLYVLVYFRAQRIRKKRRAQRRTPHD